MESDDTKQEKEASELKVKELEQKLELEKSTIKRQEVNTINYIYMYMYIYIHVYTCICYIDVGVTFESTIRTITEREG